MVSLKRRRSTANIASIPSSAQKQSGSHNREPPPTTPRKTKKRVRFSDPGPEVSRFLSTGLTPAVQRCSFQNGLLSVAPRRPRCSLDADASRPAIVYDLTGAEDEVVQFSPLRQLLSPRTRRRLRRNSLSEEMNNIDTEKRQERKTIKAENDDLKERLFKREEQMHMLKEIPELVRYLDGSDASRESDDNSRDSVQVPEAEDLFGGSTPPTPSSIRHEVTGISRVDVSFLNGLETADIGAQRHASAYLETPPETPRHPRRRASPVSQGVQCEVQDRQKEILEDALVVHKSALERMSSTLEEAAQVHHRLAVKLKPYSVDQNSQAGSDLAAIDEALDALLTTITLTESKAEDAEAFNKSLFGDITSLGFQGKDSKSMIASLRSHFREARLELEYMCPGENVGGFEPPRLLSLLLHKIRTLLGQIQDRDDLLEHQRGNDTELYEQINVKDKIINDLKGRVFDLEQSADEKNRSMKKLHAALDSYRKEVADLESLVARIEAEYTTSLAQVQQGHDEAVADLETRLNGEFALHVEAEWAESLCQMNLDSLQHQLESTKATLQLAQSEVAAAIEARENDTANYRQEMNLQQHRHGANLAARDARMLALRKKNDDLTQALLDAKHVIVGLEAAKKLLEGKIEREKGSEVIKALLPDVKSLLEAMEKASSGAEVAEERAELKKTADIVETEDTFVKPRLGFGTPSEEEPRRNRKLVRDSGIGALDEDGDGIMADY
ncbi:MAG: hypothetical protein M1814_003337 [Vezdaea aestivalis]|nr:MAG: hypothetical protein M1814_003337 [Vezdaea aestivalis]